MHSISHLIKHTQPHINTNPYYLHLSHIDDSRKSFKLTGGFIYIYTFIYANICADHIVCMCPVPLKMMQRPPPPSKRNPYSRHRGSSGHQRGKVHASDSAATNQYKSCEQDAPLSCHHSMCVCMCIYIYIVRCVYPHHLPPYELLLNI